MEVKCPYSIHEANTSIKLAVEKKKYTSLEIHEKNMRLKRNHDYFFQIQGQLNITGRSRCHFLVYVTDSNYFVETIEKDETLWKQKMLPKLLDFYNNCILEEIVRKRMSRGERCYDPEPEESNEGVAKY